MKGNCVVTSTQSAKVPSPPNIGEYNTANGTLVQNYLQPSGFSSPLFVAVDSTGHVWFTEPNSNAIGRLTPGSTPAWEQWTIPTANAIPYDLVVDKHGWIVHVL